MRVVRLALVLLALTPLSAAAAIPASERDALLAFHQATGGAAWIDSTGWLGAPGTECSWYGVGCDEAGATVVEISLPGNQLAGGLPTKLSSLANLRYLDLGDNALAGTIGSEITALAKLQSLYLGRNRFGGAIPASIGTMRALRILALDSNELEGPLPPEIGQLTEIEELYLHSNRISSLPSTVASLVRLVVLDAADNRLSAIPKELGGLTALEALYLQSNLLSGSIPAELGGMTALRDLGLSYNALTGAIPKELGALTQLEMLDLAANRLSEEIPAELGDLALLRTLSLYDNELEGNIPNALFELTALEDLYLGSNDLSGSIPAGISGLSSLRYLAIGNNELHGPIPAELGSIATLEGIELYDNELTGTIPPELMGLPNLRWLGLGGNELTGEIPPALANLAHLEELSLYHNRFTGTIPRELGQLADLQSLYLGGNLLGGSIPGELAALSRLSVLHLGDNRLSGGIPEWIGDLTSLRELILGTNELSGPIPSSITRLTALTYLDLGGNRLTGSIPPDIGALRALEYFTLGYNFLEGQIPPSLWSLANMIDLRLDGLGLSGSLPAEIGNLTKLEVLLLGDNDLSGSIPPEVGDLSSLLYLSLGLNRLTGTIPREIGSLTNLLYLDLSLNALTGPIPGEIAQLTALEPAGSDFDYNALFTGDASVAAFVDSAQYDGNFRDSQTVTPIGLRIASSTDRSMIAEWTPIVFTDGEGGYRITVSTSPGGTTAATTMTASKEVSSAKIRGLSASTTYYATIAAVTHPDGWRKNVVVSPESAPVSGSTGPAVAAPADVDLTAVAKGLIQIDGVAANEDSFTLTNFGDATTTIALERNGDFFTIDPASFTLAGGASRTVTLKSVTQPAGGYWGDVWPSGAGVPEELSVPVTLLSVSRPAGAVVAEAVTARIEITGLPGTDSIGSARFRNRGTAPLAGVVVSDVPWLVPETEPIAISAGETGSVNFTVVRSRRPAGAGESALTGTLTLVYVDGAASEDSSAKRALTTGTTGVSKTLVTVVDIPKPKVGTSPIPALGPGEIAFFAPGIASVPGVSRSLVSDLGVANAYGTRPVDDLKVYYSRLGSTSVSVATIAAIASESAVSFANVIPSVYGATAAETGTLQLRSSSLDRLVVHGRLLNLATAGGSLLAEIPILRSDRSARPTETIVLTGLAKTATIATDLFIQETSGAAATALVELLDAAGVAIGVPQTIALDAFGTAAIEDVAPAGAVTAIVTHGGTAGRLAAHVRVTDSATGDLWSVVDWSRNQQRVVRSAALRIPTVASSQGGSARKRLVGRSSSPGGLAAASTSGSLATELWLHNPGLTDSLVELALIDAAGSRRTAGVTLGPRTTMRYADVVSTLAGGSASGSLAITPKRGEIVAFARLRIADPACGSCGAVLPIVPAGSGLRAGQNQRFSGLEGASAATVSARKPGTFRSGFGVVETSGSPVTVRASLKLADGRSPVSRVLFRDVALGAGSSVAFDDLAAALYGTARGESDLHDLQVDFEVIEGSGSAVVWVTSTDNATGDTIVRTE